jgi:hypothetical protein
MGAYGDPAMVRIKQWRMLLAGSAGRTGYTHAWRRMWAQALKPYVMASVDSVKEQDIARAMGWRTFRVRTESEGLQVNEFACPASPEGGLRKQCITCKACDGADRAGKASCDNRSRIYEKVFCCSVNSTRPYARKRIGARIVADNLEYTT